MVFVTFPLNFVIFGLNDFTDGKADSLNPRKGNYLFGPRFSKKELEPVFWQISAVVLPCVAYFSYLKGREMFLLLLFMIVVSIIYNFKPFRIKRRPPLEIIFQVWFLFIALFSILLNDLEMMPWQTFLFLALFAFHAQLAGEIMDIEPDMLTDKKSTAVLIGRKKAKLLMLFLILLEVFILKFWFNDWVLSGILAAFAIWLVLDIFVFFEEKPYTVKQMKIFGIALNVAAILTIAWVLYSGNLLHPNF